MSAPVAAIDCGTNSVRLLVAREVDGRLVDVCRDLHITRLGQGVDATGRFAAEALQRTLDAVADFAGRIAHYGCDKVRFVATSAARDASNRAEFFAGVRALTGVDAEIISGEEEARLSFQGAMSSVQGASWPVLVMDIGGGSTELVLGDADGVKAAVSLNVGSVRIRERFLHSDPPTADEIAAARAHIEGLIANSGVDVAAARTWVGVGGTATSLAALVLGLHTYDRSKVDGCVLAGDAVQGLSRDLLAMPVAQVRAMPTMHPQRADVICAGGLVAASVGARTGLSLRVSESDILDGVALGLLRQG